MGYAIAAVAARRGHRVDLVSGPVNLPPPHGVLLVRVTSAAEMFRACVADFHAYDAAILTAAVCDYRPARRSTKKLKKKSRPHALQLVPTRDICAHLGRIKKKTVLVGFAMEDHDHHAHAESKLRRKRCDAIVLNGPGNVGSDRAEIEILVANGGWTGPFRGTKAEIARRIVGLVEGLTSNRKKSPVGQDRRRKSRRPKA